MPRNIFLVGFMAVGKTSVGRELSSLTGWELVDSDDEIVARAGKPIARVFEEDGEEAFRSLERRVIQGLCSRSDRIISCGGGAFIDSENRSAMLRGGRVVCLSARPETIYERVVAEAGGNGPVRPLLAGGNPLERIEELLAQRAEAYSHAHHTVTTDDLNPEQVAREVLALYQRDDPQLEELTWPTQT